LRSKFALQSTGVGIKGNGTQLRLWSEFNSGQAKLACLRKRLDQSLCCGAMAVVLMTCYSASSVAVKIAVAVIPGSKPAMESLAKRNVTGKVTKPVLISLTGMIWSITPVKT